MQVVVEALSSDLYFGSKPGGYDFGQARLTTSSKMLADKPLERHKRRAPIEVIGVNVLRDPLVVYRVEEHKLAS